MGKQGRMGWMDGAGICPILCYCHRRCLFEHRAVSFFEKLEAQEGETKGEETTGKSW